MKNCDFSLSLSEKSFLNIDIICCFFCSSLLYSLNNSEFDDNKSINKLRQTLSKLEFDFSDLYPLSIILKIFLTISEYDTLFNSFL